MVVEVGRGRRVAGEPACCRHAEDSGQIQFSAAASHSNDIRRYQEARSTPHSDASSQGIAKARSCANGT